jgi:hypothetical protein
VFCTEKASFDAGTAPYIPLNSRNILDPEHVKLLDEASALPPEYPGWMVDRQNRDPQQASGQSKTRTILVD